VDVQDLAAHGLPLDGADGVLLGQRLEFLVADDLQIDQAVTQRAQRPPRNPAITYNLAYCLAMLISNYQPSARAVRFLHPNNASGG
jgi:hypothetical protein